MILSDPKVLSVLPLKKRGEKGWRDLQGVSLRERLLELIRKEVNRGLCTNQYFSPNSGQANWHDRCTFYYMEESVLLGTKPFVDSYATSSGTRVAYFPYATFVSVVSFNDVTIPVFCFC